MGGTVEQGGAQLSFEVAHAGRDGGLHDVQPVGGAGEAALLGDGDEGGQLPQLHGL